jgi:hypothetical protein
MTDAWSTYFDAAEFRAQNRQRTYMQDWLGHLDRLMSALDAPLLTGARSVSHRHAVGKAEAEYEKCRELLDAAPSEVEGAYPDALKRAQSKIDQGAS